MMPNPCRIARAWRRVAAIACGLAAAAHGQNPSPTFIEAREADNFKVLFIARADAAPALDGRLDDACWSRAEPVADFGFCEYGNKEFSAPRTEVRYLWDSNYLYIGLTCFEDTPDNMARHNRDTEDKSKPLYERDCVELHINGNNDNATKFQVWFIDTLEKSIFWHYDFGWGILVNPGYGLTADWDYAATRAPDHWQIEARIALSNIQVEPRVGYLFGMNPCRFRFNKSGVAPGGAKADGVCQFLTWSTQGGDHSDAGSFGKCILVDRKPASVAEGLRLALPDLEKRTIMVQTGSGFDVLDKGRAYSQSYAERAGADLAAAEAAARRLTDLHAAAAPPSVNLEGWKETAKPSLAKLAALAAEMRAKGSMTVAELNAYRKDLGGLAAAVEASYWNLQRSLLLAEGKARVAVDLTVPADTPSGRDEPGNTPDPASRTAPHVAWARNHAGGPIRALIIAKQYGSWDAYALKERMDLSADIFECTARDAFAPTTDYYKEGLLLFPRKKAQLMKLLQNRYDAYMFMDANPAMLPEDIQYVLTQRLLEGAACIAFSCAGAPWNLSALPSATVEQNIVLRESMPYRSMTRLIPPAAIRTDHLGAAIDTLARETAPLEVGPVSMTRAGKGVFASFSPGGAGYYFTTPLSPHVEQAPDEQFQNEYFCGLAVKIVLEATGRLPARRLLSLACAPADAVPGVAGTATLNTTGPAIQGTFRIVTRDQWGRVVHQAVQPASLAEGTSAVPVPLPALAAGSYYTDVWLLQGDRILDWASQRFRVRGRPTLESLVVDRQTVKPGERVSARVAVANAGPASRVVAELRDVKGRVLERQGPVAVNGGAAAVDLPVDRAWNTYLTLDVYTEEGGVNQDRRSSPIYFRHPERDDFTVFTSGEDPGRLGALRQKELQAFGITLFEKNYMAEDLLGNGGDMSLRYWLTHSHNETGGSLASEAYHRNLSETMRQLAAIGASRNVRFISTGDDSGVASDFVATYPNWLMPLVKRFATRYPLVPRDPDHYGYAPANFGPDRGLPVVWEYFRWLNGMHLPSLLSMKLMPGDFDLFIGAFREAYPTIAEFNRANGTAFPSFEAITPADLPSLRPAPCPDIIGFQDWLKRKYGTIETLNRTWGAEEKAFETIQPLETIPRLAARDRHAAMLDKLTYLEDLYIRHMQTTAEAVHAVDPAIGIGQGAAHFPNILPDVMRYTDTFAPYLERVDIEVARSLPHKWVGQTLGVYGGKAVKIPARINQAWHVLFTGGNFIWFWTASEGGLMGDLSTNPNRSGALLAAIREMKGGIASTLLRGTRLHDGIAILHSRDAGHMSGIYKEMSTQADSQSALQYIIEDLGLQYRYITSRNLEEGALQGGEFKILVLPYTQAVTEKEAAAITRFVKAGGTVIADLRAATLSLEGKALAPGALDDLFGIGRTATRALPVRAPMTVTGLGPGGVIDGFMADASVTATTARAYARLGSAPALLVNEVGNGKAITLNIGVAAYEFLLNRDGLGPGREVFRSLLALAGARSRFRVTTADGRDIPGVELAVFQRGTARYLTVEKRSFAYERYPIEARIELDQPGYATDLRSGKSLGKTASLPILLDGLGCSVFSLLPYPVESLGLSAPERVAPGGDLVLDIRLACRDGEPAPHVVRVDVATPEGTAPVDSRLVETSGGRAVCRIPVGFNDPPGTWTATVTDISSGRVASRACRVAE